LISRLNSSRLSFLPHRSRQTTLGLLLLAVLWFAFTLNYADRQFVASMFPVLRKELGFTNAQLGLTGSLFLWIYGPGSLLGGYVADRVSRARVIAFSLLLWSAATLVCGMARSPAIFLSMRALVGFTEAMFIPAATALIAAFFPITQRSRVTAVFYSGSLIGVVTGAWYGGYIAEFWNWRWAFYSLGVAGIIYALPILPILQKAESSSNRNVSRTIPQAPWSVWRITTFRCLCLCFPLYSWMLWLMYTWLPDFFYSRFHLSLTKAASFATLSLQGGMFGGLIFGGFLADWLYRRTAAARFWLIAGSIIASSPFAILLGTGHSLGMARFAAAIFGVGYGVFTANLNVSTYDVIEPARHGSALGFLNTVGTPISGLMPLIGGYLRNSLGIDGLLRYGGVVALMSGIVFVFCIRRWFAEDHRRAYPESIQVS
jgi:MFS transporter, Spinster family, sphingosine-1-phosphate transporter